MTDTPNSHLMAEIVELIPRLRRYARVLVRDADRADEFVQEALVRAVARIDQFQPGTDLRAWLFTILHNLVVSSFRRDKHRALLAERQGPPNNATMPRQEDWAALRQVETAIQRLDPRYRDLLFLATITGASYEELARELSIPIGTVRSRLNRARSHLKRQLEGGAHD
ncbi:RNA polymerase sigma factor [Roseiterribacter gracilis]|uniref:RNA polymerase sigma factor n=1 Tax=Roseiterribacter gracilis TaxID=2812848 RepID=A0A8S8X742_9PROT|nr:RNA polymerase sigma factor [Rhodospirillales bacterium TMPK1]